MPANRTWFVHCLDGCAAEGMTKEQIIAAITQAVEGHTIADVDTGFVTTIKEQNGNVAFKIWLGTQSEYNEIETPAEDTLYIISNDNTFDDIDALAEQLQSVLSGSTAIPNATHAANADNAETATNATNAGNATKVGNNAFADAGGTLTVNMSTTSTVSDIITRRHDIFVSASGQQIHSEETFNCTETISEGDLLEIHCKILPTNKEIIARAICGNGYAFVDDVLGVIFFSQYKPTLGSEVVAAYVRFTIANDAQNNASTFTFKTYTTIPDIILYRMSKII